MLSHFLCIVAGVLMTLTLEAFALLFCAFKGMKVAARYKKNRK